MKTIMRIAATTAASAAILCATTLAAAGTASANESATNCNTTYWDACLTLYYNSNQAGSHTAFQGGDADFVDNKFLSSGAGQGQGVKNNAASAWFWSVSSSARYGAIYYNSNQQGPCDAIAANWFANQLHYTYNENASWIQAPTSSYVSGCYIFS
ncbi:peptidase inhibitor family I36 protein [Streptomyces sp. Tue6028]|uniref:peptidase inhibitor family I36 protein n=1 Tax=Streptomyces sp. Tue6028 TaxID=2036037 RepID=UPI003D72909F